ncbi:MAG: Zn-ribbon domain-containing OB-fold protein [Bacillota bacterium]
MATKIDAEKWYRRNSERIGVPVELVKKYFREEFETAKPADAPLEIPDKIEIFYKYTYGRQSRFFREIRENKRLYGARCPKCGKVFCPPRAGCPHCYQDTEWIPLEGTGTLMTYTIVYFSNSAFVRKVPFVCGYIKLDGTNFLMIQNVYMEDVNKARVGMRVKVHFQEERDGSITDLYFVPVDE